MSFSVARAQFKDARLIAGRFFPDTANAPTYAGASKHPGWSVVRTSAGLFTVTFSERFAQLVALEAPALQLATGGDQKVEYGAFSIGDATTLPTLQIRVWDISGAAVADIAANANNSISFGAWVSNQEGIL